jgi:predicted ABC-type ATPase
MASTSRRPPDPADLLTSMPTGDKPLAIVLAGHNGSGKSTLWYDKLADQLRIPLVNADRLTLSILPPPIDQKQTLRPWAANLRDNDERWQKLSQDGVQLFMGLIMDQHMPFAFETVFSYLERQADGNNHAERNRGIIMHMATIHISAAEAAHDFTALLAHVRAGAEVIIEDGSLTVAVLHTPAPPRRSIEECIALLPEDSAATIDEDFARDVAEAVTTHREPLNPPAWD